MRFILLLVFFFSLGFSAIYFKDHAHKLAQGEKLFGTTIEKKFQPTDYPIKNHPFVIVIIGRNNGKGVEKTLQSAVCQNYENYRIIYVDDGSDDGSFEFTHDLIFENHWSHKIQLMQSSQKQGLIATLSQTIESILPEEIVVLLHGEDLLAHEWVLQKLNQYYANPDLWLTIGGFMKYPSFEKKVLSSPLLPRNLSSGEIHLKTFFASLFKKIHPKDLYFQENLMPDSVDSAYMIPLIEMAGNHFQVIDEILYLETKPIERDEVMHTLCENTLKNKIPYTALKTLFEKEL